MRKLVLMCLMLSVMAVVSCSSSSSSNPDLPEVDYVGAAKEIAPLFTAPVIPDADIIKADEVAPTWGDRAFEIAVIFADDKSLTLGTNNIYNNVGIAQMAYETFVKAGEEEINLADYVFTKEITSPIFGTKRSYQYATNYVADEGESTGGVAIKSQDGVSSIFVGHAVDEEKVERSLVEATFNETTNVLTMNVICFVDYDVEQYTGTNQGQFIMRMDLNGNKVTNEFNELKVVKYNANMNPEGYYINIVGKGVSQGTDKYFLFKITDERGSDPAVTNKYFCVPSNNLTDKIILTPLEEAEVAETDCSDYLADVKAMTPLSVEDDLPSAKFSVAIEGAKEYVMINPLPTP